MGLDHVGYGWGPGPRETGMLFGNLCSVAVRSLRVLGTCPACCKAKG